MARTSKNAKAAITGAGAAPSAMTTMSTSESAWSPAPGVSTTQRSTVSARPGGLGIGSPIYEELVAELGDPAA